jgi:KaiC/GvpD/RAD55 family RecA-like ATPase
VNLVLECAKREHSMDEAIEPQGLRDSLERIRTGISAAYWFEPANQHYEPALLPNMTRSTMQQTGWFDELFEGGLKIPKAGLDPPLIVLLTGTPGTGKSTLALELCYRLANPDPLAQGSQKALSSIYLTTEGHLKWTIEHAKNFNWDPNNSIFGDNADHLVQIRELKSSEDLQRFVEAIGGAEGVLSRAARLFGLGAFKEMPAPSSAAVSGKKKTDVIVLDNLNTVRPNPRLWFPFVNDLTQRGFRLFVLVLDTDQGGTSRHAAAAKAWGYLADVVIHMDRQYPVGYMIRTIEILKARYQRHVYGQHQMKILNGIKAERPYAARIAREHPYRSEGGIFIFPSMHLALSRRKTIVSPPPDRLPTPFPPLDELLGGGFLTGRCVALAGSRGTHKSRLAFAQVLKTLADDPRSRALVISLHEDEGSVLKELSDIESSDTTRGHGGPRAADKRASPFVRKAVDSGRLELSYYPAGFIAPEEFFHRVQLSIARHRKAAPNERMLLVFNSLDLLHSHFPLCALHRIFVPALVELLCLENVTSFFIATTKPEEDPYGLMSMADPVLRFARVTHRREFLTERVFERQHGDAIGDEETIVQMTIERFAAGVSAGADVYLALIEDDHPLVTTHGLRSGLQCFRDKALARAAT